MEEKIKFTEEEIKEIISSIEAAPIDGYGSMAKNRAVYTTPYRKLVALIYAKILSSIEISSQNISVVESQLNTSIEELDEDVTKLQKDIQDLDKNKVNKSGDTMNGPLTVESQSGPGKVEVSDQGVFVTNGGENGTAYDDGAIVNQGKRIVIPLKDGTMALEENTITSIGLWMGVENYQLNLVGYSGTRPVVHDIIDLPLESMVVGGEYNGETKQIELTLQNGNVVSFPVDELVNGLISSSEKGAPNGVASLDADGKVPKEQLPDGIGGAANMEEGTGKGAVQQVADGVENGFDFTGKNPNATTLDATLTGNIPYGATGEFASAFGGKSSAQGKRSHAEGTTTIAKGKYSHAEGDNAVALGDQSHAEGYATTAAGLSSHAEGVSTATTEEGAHAEGVNTIAIGYAAHAEGGDTVAEGVYSHAEGNHAEARHNNSHAGGFYTKTGTVDQTVLGHFNIGKTDTLFEVGNGAGTDNRSNAIEVLKDGRTKVQGKPKEDDDVVRLEELKAAISGSGKYVLLTEEHATNPYKVPDNIRYVKFICDKTSSIDTYLGANISLGSVRYLLFRGTSFNSTPLTTSFSKDGYLSLTSVGPTRYFALVELVESIENLDDLL